MAIVTVRGSATVGASPDEATVTIELTELRATSEEAYTQVAERSEALEALLDELGVERVRRSSGGIAVGEHVEYVDGREQHRGYRAVASTSLRLADAALVASVLREAVSRAGARVDGPSWLVRPDNPAHLEAAKAAAAVARRKAEAYADALGVRLGALERVTEPGLEPPTPKFAARARLAADVGPPTIGVEPGELLVSASVDVTYVLEQA